MKQQSLFKIIFLSILIVFIGISNAQNKKHNEKENHAKHWSYNGETGPENWGKLNPEYSACLDGKSQSPIDIKKVFKTNLESIKFAYENSPVNLVNNGHTIQENYKPGSSAVFEGERFNLLQFHFHTPSEHTVNGKHYAMEVHLVHKNAKGQIAVIGVFFKAGKANPVLQKLIDNFPKEVNKPVLNNSIEINAENLLPADKLYYHYFGSLTTPPCTEGVNWNIFTTPVEASQDQINKFEKLMGKNARPVQPLNFRFVLESN